MTMQLFTGEEYLAIDIANNFGLDKKKWDERLTWFYAHEAELETLLTAAKEPALFHAGVCAWRAHKRGEISGYPISLDACSSGLQILACLTSDRVAAEICNVVDTGNREDAYTFIYTAMCERLGNAKVISRDEVKEAIMTSLYGSKAVPQEIFGKGALLKTFESTMQVFASGPWKLNKLLLDLWNPTKTVYSWVLPDNFHVHCKVKNVVFEDIFFAGAPEKIMSKVVMPSEDGRSLSANTVHSIDGYIVRELTRRCNYKKDTLAKVKTALCNFSPEPSEKDKNYEMVAILWDNYERTGMLSARIIDYIDEDSVSAIKDRAKVWDVISTFPKEPFEVISVHDAFRCLPNNGNDLRKMYNRLLAEITNSNLLNHLISNLAGREVTIPKKDPTLYLDILQSNYSLS